MLHLLYYPKILINPTNLINSTAEILISSKANSQQTQSSLLVLPLHILVLRVTLLRVGILHVARTDHLLAGAALQPQLKLQGEAALLTRVVEYGDGVAVVDGLYFARRHVQHRLRNEQAKVGSERLAEPCLPVNTQRHVHLILFVLFVDVLALVVCYRTQRHGWVITKFLQRKMIMI